MFILHSSNKTENLVEHLVSVLKYDSLSLPFSKELFVIQSQGLERWLSQQMANRFDVWANYEFIFPWKFFSQIAEHIDNQTFAPTFDRNHLLWRFEAMLRQLDNEDFLPIQNYLSGQNPSLKRFQLAKQLAKIFDQYQIMRPELLAAWQNNQLLYGEKTERWQKSLWLQLTNQMDQPHRGEQWLDVIAKLNSASEGALSGKLPERVSIFGINTMPPLFLSYLQSLARHCQIHLYLLNPAQTYWADLAGKRQLIENTEPNGHPLLRNLGQQGREFQELLLEFTQFDFEPESFIQTENPNNLQQLQNDILNNDLTAKPLIRDNSLSLYACHSRKREVEVLKDQLLLALDSDASLELRDIVVMAPNIQLYEPFINAVFHDIQHSIADRGLRQEEQYLDVYLRFLELSQSRLGWQSVLDVLERDEVYPAFSLSETDLELIKFWVEDTNVRWGQSGKHKQELGLPTLDENTWQNILERLLMGYASGQDDQFVLGVLPYKNIEGSSAAALGGLNDYLQLIFKARTDFKIAKSLKAWSEILSRYAEQLFGNTDTLERLELNQLLQDLSTTLVEFHHELVELPVVIQWLEGMVSERISVNGFLRGKLTFCSMIPMRAIPFKIIALIGINEGEFPRVDRHPTFDLLSQHFRKGDRSGRADDRYQFLEILLSARQQLLITYIGQSQATNERIAPSVVVNELLDVLKDVYQLTGLITYHPLQAFSPSYFDSTTELASFSKIDCDIVKSLATPTKETSAWWQGDLQADPEEVIEISDLFNFFQHPQRYFLRKQVGLQLTEIYSDIEEREPFSLNELPIYRVFEEWIAQSLHDKTISVDKLKAQGRWLAGTIGELEFDRHQSAVIDFVNRIRNIDIGPAMEALAIDAKIGDCRLIGKLGNRFQNGNLIYRYANLKGKDFINAWLYHLITNLVESRSTHLLTADFYCLFSPIQYPTDLLAEWLEIYQKGLRQPNTFFTEAALAYVQQLTNPKAKKTPLEAAIATVFKAMEYDSDIRQLFGNNEDLNVVITETFGGYCETLLAPIWQAAHGG